MPVKSIINLTELRSAIQRRNTQLLLREAVLGRRVRLTEAGSVPVMRARPAMAVVEDDETPYPLAFSASQGEH